MTQIHEICLVPRAIDAFGRIFNNLVEGDIIRAYQRAMSDELNCCGVRHRIDKEPRAWEFVVSCGVGWHGQMKKPQVSNRSRIWIARDDASVLGNLLAETLSDWGKTYVCFEHRSCKPLVIKDDSMLLKGKGGLHIEPFFMDGMKAQTYAQRLEQLGTDLGRSIADYVVKGTHGAKIKTTTVESVPAITKIRY